MSDFLSYWAFRLVETVARMLPVPLAWRLGAAMGRVAWWLSARYRRLVVRNLTIAYGQEKDAAAIRALAKQHLRHVAANFVAGMKFPWMTPEKAGTFLEYEGIERLEAAMQERGGAVMALMHMGNWELLCQAPRVAAGGTAGGLYQSLHNERLDAHVLRLRARTGSKLFDRADGFHAPVAFVRDRGVLAVLADQRAGAKGVWAPFFGRLASTTTLPALLAKRAGVPFFPVGVMTIAPGRWRMIVGEEVPGIQPGLSAEESAAIMNERLEQIIRRSPADWFWVHNRWRTPQPELLLTNARRGMVLGNDRGVEELVPFEIIIRAPDSLTDACLSIPAVRAIRRGRPDSHLTVLTCASLADLWRMESEADEVLVFPDDATVPQVAKLVRATGVHYDAGVLFTDDRAGAEVLRRAGVALVAGYEGPRRRKLDVIIPGRKNPGPVVHRTRDFLRIALRLGANVDDPTLTEVSAPAAEDETGPEVIIGIAPGATLETARWPVEKFAAAAQEAAAEWPGVQFLIFGTGEEKQTGAALAAALGSAATDLTGRTTVAELAGHLCRCRVLLANDNGALHFAALLGVPVVGIYGPTEPAQTAPLGDTHTILRRHVECSPCFLEKCAMGDHRCMAELPPARAAAALRAVLSPLLTV